jgi:hypothetical protein
VAIDLSVIPDLTCGRTYRSDDAEARVAHTRHGEVTPYAGCGKPMTWVHAYRCRQCARWLHGDCMDRHFGDTAAAPAAELGR